MWIVLPLIFFMSWRSCRRVGQAVSETAAWVLGYLAFAGVILALDYGGVGMVSAKPDDPAAAVALVGGFVGMGISRYLWKRRGGHLEPYHNPLLENRWVRASVATFRAFVPAKPRQVTKARSSRPASAKPATNGTTTKASAQPKATASAASQPATSSQPRPATARPSSTAPKTNGATKTTKNGKTGTKTAAYRAGRVIGAMLDTDASQRRTRR